LLMECQGDGVIDNTSNLNVVNNPVPLTPHKIRLSYYNDLSAQVIRFCQQHGIEYHIKKGTRNEAEVAI